MQDLGCVVFDVKVKRQVCRRPRLEDIYRKQRCCNWARDGDEWHLHQPAALSRDKNLGSHWIGGWMGLIAGLDLFREIISYPDWDSNFLSSSH